MKALRFGLLPWACLLTAIVSFPGGAGAEPLPVPKAEPAVRNSFVEVTRFLEPGGNLFVYVGCEPFMRSLSEKVDSLFALAIENSDAADVPQIEQVAGMIHRGIDESGLADITGLGLSSYPIGEGLFRTRGILHRYPENNRGKMWDILGAQPHALGSLAYMPADTAFAAAGDFDVHLFWTWVESLIMRSDMVEAKNGLRQMYAEAARAKVDLDGLLRSVKGEVGVALVLSQTRQMKLPMPGLQIPDPSLFFFVQTRSDAIFDQIDSLLQQNPDLPVDRSDTETFRRRVISLPIPFVQPTILAHDGYLFVATNPHVLNDAMAAKAGEKPGLVAAPEFQLLSQGIELKGNQWSFVSERLGTTIMEIQRQALGQQMDAAGRTVLARILGSSRPMSSFGVMSVTEEGIVTTGIMRPAQQRQ